MAATILALSSTTAAAEAWRAERVTGSVAVDSGGSLADGAPVAANARIQLDDDGALTLWRAGTRLRLRGPGELALFAADRPEVARVQLKSGTMRADAPAGRDLRVNAGQLRLRLVNAEAWTAAAPDGDRVCALDGTTQVQLPNATQTLMLEHTGACLRLLEDGTLLHERPTRSELNARLARADGGSDPLPVTFTPAPAPDQSGPAAAAATTQAAMQPSAPSSSAQQPTDAMPAEDDTPSRSVERVGPGADSALYEQAWFVVIGAFTDNASAREVLKKDQRIAPEEAHVLRIARGGLFRSAVGPYTDRDSAEKRRASLREQYPGAWLLRPGARPE